MQSAAGGELRAPWPLGLVRAPPPAAWGWACPVAQSAPVDRGVGKAADSTGRSTPDRQRAGQPSTPRPESLAFPSSHAPCPDAGGRVISSRMKWMASQEPAEREPPAARQPVVDQRQSRVFRTARRKAAVPPEERRQQHLVPRNEGHGGPNSPAHTARRGTATRASFNSATSAANGRSSTTRLAMTMSATPAGAALRVTRKASRSRRRARFRETAPRICRVTANPARLGPSASRHSTTNDGRSTRLPCRKSA